MTQTLTESEKALLERLHDRGVRFTYHLLTGWVELNIEHLEHLLEVDDKLQFDADLSGLPAQLIQQWRDHRRHPRCHALNSKGEPCGAYVETVWDPREFDPERDVYCRYHSDVT
jgi:hypothetical protein